MISKQRIVFAALLGVMFSTAASAIPFLVDQSATGIVAGDAFGNGTGIDVAAGAAQSFVPALNSLDVVELQLNDQSPANGLGVDLVVNIRENSLSGAVVGTSDVLTRPDQPTAAIQLFQFAFSSAVTLTPNLTYVIEILRVAGFEDSAAFFSGTGSPDSYPQGTAFIFGTPFANSRDLWFREGPALVPEPSIAMLLTLGLIAPGLFAAKRTRAQ